MLVEKDKLMKFNVVVANPPFSLDKWGAENAESDPYKRFFRGVPPKSKGDWAFITHMVETSLAGEGRVVVVVPHGVLFRGSSEGKIREAMIRENLLDAVIGLPENLFPTTSIPVAILVFDRSREIAGKNAKRKDVLFIDASREFVQGKKQNSLSEENISKIVATYKKRKNVDKYAHVATFEEIEGNEFNLNIPRYVDTFEEEAPIDVDAVQKDIDRLEKELAEVRKQMAQKLKEIKRG
jgi:type I restriction enzyme M protein